MRVSSLTSFTLHLVRGFFALALEVHTTRDVIDELHPEQQRALDSWQARGKLTIHVLSAQERDEMSRFSPFTFSGGLLCYFSGVKTSSHGPQQRQARARAGQEAGHTLSWHALDLRSAGRPKTAYALRRQGPRSRSTRCSSRTSFINPTLNWWWRSIREFNAGGNKFVSCIRVSKTSRLGLRQKQRTHCKKRRVTDPSSTIPNRHAEYSGFI